MECNSLVTENMGLAYDQAIRLSKIHIDLEIEDIIQICFLGLIKAARKFDESLGFKFSTYAYKTMWGEVKRHVRDEGWFKGRRKDKPYKPSASLDAEFDRGENKNTTLFDSLGDNDYNFETIELKLVMEQVLTKEELYVLHKLFIEETYQSTLAKEFNKSQVTISRIKIRAIKKLRKALEIDKKRVA